MIIMFHEKIINIVIGDTRPVFTWYLIDTKTPSIAHTWSMPWMYYLLRTG